MFTDTAIIPAPAAALDRFRVPTEDHDELWKDFDDGERKRIGLLLVAFAQIAAAKSVDAGCHAVAPWVAAQLPAERGLSAKSIRRHYDAYISSGCNWRSLKRNYRGPKAGLPEAFRQWFPSLYLECPSEDTFAASVERLKQMWIKNEPIKGYGCMTEWWAANKPGKAFPERGILRPSYFPEGWSVGNLKRLLPKSKALRALCKQGYKAAHDFFGPQLLRDRSHLRPLQLVTMDDYRLDIQCLYRTERGEWQAVYVDSVFALDVATGFILGYCIKPRWQREDKTRVAVSREDTKHVLIDIFRAYGLPKGYPMGLLLENASATLSKDETTMLRSFFGGRLLIDHTGVNRQKLLSAGWREQSGMPWQKGWLEALFALVRRTLNHLPGATGRRYDDTPLRLQAQTRYAIEMCEQADALQIRNEDMALPLLRFDELDIILADMVRALNCRIKHRLQGFGTVLEWEDAQGEWHPADELSALPEDERMGISLVERRESPAERFARLRAANEFETVAPAVLAYLYAERRRVKVRAGKICVDDRKLSADKIWFFAAGHEALVDGAEYLAAVSENLNCIHLWTVDGERWAGSVPRLGTVDAGDRKAVERGGWQVGRERAEIVKDAREVMAPANAALVDMRAHNDTMIRRAKEVAGMVESAKAIERSAPRKRPAGQGDDGPQVDLSELIF